MLLQGIIKIIQRLLSFTLAGSGVIIFVEALDKVAQFFGMPVDEVIHFEDAKILSPVKVEDKTANEKVQLISQLDEEDKNVVYRIIDGMLTKNKFQTFCEQNIQTAK